MWRCVWRGRTQQYFARRRSRDGRKRTLENTNGSLVGTCPSLSVVFPKAPLHLVLLRCIFPGAHHPCRTWWQSVWAACSKEMFCNMGQVLMLSALPGAWSARIWRDSQASCPERWGGQGKVLGACWSLWSDEWDRALGKQFLLEAWFWHCSKCTKPFQSSFKGLLIFYFCHLVLCRTLIGYWSSKPAFQVCSQSSHGWGVSGFQRRYRCEAAISWWPVLGRAHLRLLGIWDLLKRCSKDKCCLEPHSYDMCLWLILCFSCQARVKDLEEQCRSQTEQFSLLSQELKQFRLQTGKIDLLTSTLVTSELPLALCSSTPQPHFEKGNCWRCWKWVIFLLAGNVYRK